MDLYELLGVDKNATSDEIKKAYKRKAMKCHSDREGGDDEAFKEITNARDILMDPESRDHYDRTGTAPDKTSIETLAETRLLALFSQVLDIEGFEGDMVDMANTMIRTVLAQYDKAIKGFERESARLLKVLGSVSKKGEGANLFENLVAERLKACESKTAQAKKELEVLAVVVDMMNWYEYSGEPPTLGLYGVSYQQPTGGYVISDSTS